MDSRKDLCVPDVIEAAGTLDIDPAALQAVIDVESGGGWFQDIRRKILDGEGRRGGFLADHGRQPAILFEAHIFSRQTDGRFDADHPGVSAPRWDRSLYRGGPAEYERLDKAMELDRAAALKSASWGLFQILGQNHRACGFDTVDGFVEAMFRSEVDHLDAVIAFLKANDLVAPLRERDWHRFARGYNGPAYAEHGYHERLADRFEINRGRMQKAKTKPPRKPDRGSGSEPRCDDDNPKSASDPAPAGFFHGLWARLTG